MDPITLGSAGLSLAGMFMGAYGQYKAGKVNQQLSEYRSRMTSSTDPLADGSRRRGGAP